MPDKQCWIKCSDKLPEFWTYVWITDYRHKVEVCMLSHKGYWVDVSDEEWMYDLPSVLAWMPYYEPEPFYE